MTKEERDFFIDHVADSLLDVWNDFEASHSDLSVEDLIEITSCGAARLIAMNVATEWLINGEQQGDLLLATQVAIFKTASAIYHDDGSRRARKH